MAEISLYTTAAYPYAAGRVLPPLFRGPEEEMDAYLGRLAGGIDWPAGVDGPDVVTFVGAADAVVMPFLRRLGDAWEVTFSPGNDPVAYRQRLEPR